MHDARHKGLEFRAVAAELEKRFSEGIGSAWSEADFESLATTVFRLQYERSDTYRTLCERRGATPETVAAWTDAPCVPAMAFKHLDLAAFDGRPEAVFRTSGTTGGAAARGRHLVPSLSLYRASLLGPFRAHVTGPEPIRFVSMVPSAEELPDSSLSYMVSAAAEALATETHWLVDREGTLDMDGLRAIAAQTARDREPIVLLGTSLAFVHALDRLADRPLTRLADGSRIMETGGFKGLERSISRRELYARITAGTGVPTARIVNEYGMTELLSQLYEPVLTEGRDALGTHVAPPWMRVRALDPMSLVPVPEGEDGVLAFFDLANAGSACHVLTEDLGSVTDGRVRLLGRVVGAEPRGCSRAMDELMSIAERHR